MSKYWTVFKLGWSKILEYRVEFLMSRLRSIVILLLFYFVWYSLTYKTGEFAGYTLNELVTYVFGINILRSIIIGAEMTEPAEEINNGFFSKYLTQPVNFFSYNFFRELPQRTINLIAGVLEVWLFSYFFQIQLVFPASAGQLGFFFLSLALALGLFYILSFLMNLLAFWSREAMGPRFLFDWIFLFLSGAYFPLDVLSRSLLFFASFLPFYYIIFFPMSVYLGRINGPEILQGYLIQIVWIVASGLITSLVWQKGLKRYTGEGI